MAGRTADRDILLERLERKLAAREKELEELKKMVVGEDEVAEIKRDILHDLKNEFKKVLELEARVVELSKTVESLMSEVLYLKAELRRDYPIERIEREGLPEQEEPEGEPKESNIIVCD